MPARSTTAFAMPASLAVVSDHLVAGTNPETLTPSLASGRVTQALEQLSSHLAQLLGEAGVRALLARSVAVSSAEFPWLANTIPSVGPPVSPPWASLRAAMERQDPHTIRAAFTALMASFAGLLARLIGDGLAAHLMREAWPIVVSHPDKEST